MSNQDDEEEIERDRLHSHWAGQAASLEAFEVELKRMAGEAFSNGRDDNAKLIREIATLAGKKALDYRKRQKDFEKRFSGGV